MTQRASRYPQVKRVELDQLSLSQPVSDQLSANQNGSSWSYQVMNCIRFESYLILSDKNLQSETASSGSDNSLSPINLY